MKKLSLLILILMISALVCSISTNEKCSKRYYTDGNGELMTVISSAGYPPEKLPVRDAELPKEVRKAGEKGFFALSNVPAYSWCYGAVPTSAAIMAAYYDNFGSPGVYTGAANGGVAPQTNAVWNSQSSQPDTDQCPLAASKEGVDGRAVKGHGDDYWVEYIDESDPYYGNWTEHNYYLGQPCTADFMGSNQWYKWGNYDGESTIYSSISGVSDYYGAESGSPPKRDAVHGIRLFYESLGLSVDENYTRTITGYDDPYDNPDMGPAVGGYEFSMFKESVDLGRPVLIHLEGQTIVGFGYDDSYDPPRIYIRDTWDMNTIPTAHYIVWGGQYYSMQMYAVSEIVLGTECYYAAPTNLLALNNNRNVTVSWDDPSKGTKNMSYIVFRDGVQIAAGVTSTSYVDSGASDGVHNWSVKAYYVNDSFTSFMSLTAEAYVSASVTSFSDDFERTDLTDKWLFDPADGEYGAWGRDTQYKYAGLASLSDSPGTNYVDNTELHDLGGGWKGHKAEIAPGLDFSEAGDATCSFWLRYLIEESFDYLHFQASDDGVTWETLKTWSSESNTSWNNENINLGLYAGESNVRLRFILVTDPGYTAAGSNIDDLSITTTTFDPTPPFIYYTKTKDYYSSKSDGFEIETEIHDFSGINYARVYFKVNGGTEQYVNPASVNGDMYFWKLPVQYPGDMIEFRIEAQDTNGATGSKGPFYYVEGMHQKYDYSTVSYYGEIVTSTNQYDQKSYAVKFSSFHNDIVGAVVRGYDDASQPEDNADMIIHVWADNNGLPGANLIVPFSVPNPATLSETNAWGYVDLSSYTNLDDMSGDYYIGFECGTDPATGVTRTTFTDTNEAGEFDFGRAFMQYYAVNGGSLTWEIAAGCNYHIRCITTDYGIAPGIIDPSPDALSEEHDVGDTSTRTLYVNNIGGYQLDYTASIEYDGYASSVTAHVNDFESVLGWTPSGTRYWARSTTIPTVNGSVGYARVTATTTETTHNSYLTSPAIDMTDYGSESWISFQHVSTLASRDNTQSLEVSVDGTNWNQIWTHTGPVGTMGTPDLKTVIIPADYLTSTTRFRFHAYLPSNSGSWNIDDITINGAVPYSWLTLDGGATTSGTVAVAGSDPITVGFNSADIESGVYTANIRLASEYSNESVPVQLTVFSYYPETVHVTTSVTDSLFNISWMDWYYYRATGFKIYSSDDPYGEFTLEETIPTNAVFGWSTPLSSAKKFYYVTYYEGTKDSDEQLKKVMVKQKSEK